jgi:formyltetrahydrofolate deformylase
MKQFCTITVIGRDKTGVVARVTNFLFEQKANIEALEEQVTRGQFSMTIQASWKRAQFRPETVRTGLQHLAAALGMEIKLQVTEPSRRQRVALFVTREPHCLAGVMRAFKHAQLKPAEPRLVVSNRPDLKPLAEKFGLPFAQFDWNDRAQAESQALALLERHGIDLVVLARFMNKIINIHPSLLPSFPGAQAYRQAYEHGVKVVGVTAHFVSMNLDEGPIIAQESFRVPKGATLKEITARGQKLETKALVRAVDLCLRKRLDVYWGTVKEV